MIKVMDEIPSSSPVGGPVAPESLQSELKSLRSVTTILLVAMVCIGMALTIFFYHQARILNRKVSEGERLVDDYNSNAAPRIQWFVGNLQAFAKTNPDLNPILAKYNLLAPQNPVAPAARPVAPAPTAAPAPAPKK